jgi:alkylated DNA nucleotide flippase Atl1
MREQYREQYIEAVLAVADLIPPARVLSYGDIATLLESGGPRQVGAVMSAHGNAVAWWRVVRASGAAPACHEGQALEHYRVEHMALRGDTAPAAHGRAPSWRVEMKTARWNPTEAEFILLDAIAAGLQHAASAADLAADDGVPAAAGAAAAALAPAPGPALGETSPGKTGMSVPRDGLYA